MILDIAASLLNENYTITEAADTVARQGVTRWLKNEYPYIKFGTNPDDPVLDDHGNPITDDNGNVVRTNIEDIFNEANMVFGHPLNLGAQHRYKFIEKYLPGAVRIAFTECGWKSNNEDRRMMSTLKAIYAALFFNWWDGCQYTWVREGRSRINGHWEARNPGYKGLIDGPSEVAIADFNGMSFKELYDKFKDLIPEVKARLAAQAQQASAEERAEAEEERPAAPTVRNNTPYHIEYIATHAEAKRWEPLTNHRTTHAGCHWCITDRDICNWNHYNCGRTRFVYFCWKAASMQALKDMNIMDSEPGHYYSFCPNNASERQLKNAPMNEYGLSLICIMVENDGNGEPRFHQATSRYNHTDPAGHDMCEGMYGDNLVPQHCDVGYRKILRILEMDDAEFKRTFKIPNVGPVNHDDIMNKVRRAREQHNVRGLFDELSIYESYDNGAVINDHDRYNFLRSDGTFASDVWFRSMKQLSTTGQSIDTFIVKKEEGTFNILQANGKYLLERDVLDIEQPNVYSFSVKYAKIKVKPNLYNIVNLDTGLIMLKKPVFDVFLQNNYTKGIVVRKAEGEPLSVQNIQGREIYKFSNPQDWPVASTKDAVVICDNPDDHGLINVKLMSISNGKVLWKRKFKESDSCSYRSGSKTVCISSDRYSALLSYTGKVLFDTNENKSYSELDSTAYFTPTNSDYVCILGARDRFVFNLLTGDKKVFNRSDVIIYVDNEKTVVHPYNTSDKVLIQTHTGEIIKTYENVYSVSNEFITIKDGRGSYKVVNAKNDKTFLETTSNVSLQTFRRNKDTSIAYAIFKDNNKYYIVDDDGEMINKVELKTNEISSIYYLGFNCFGASFRDEKVNILAANGKWMFKHNFSSLQNRYFDTDGIMTIKAGNKTYYINVEGDVSRTIEALAESFNTAAENANILVETADDGFEEPVVVEETKVEEQSVEEKKDISLVDLSMYFMD